MLNAYATNQTLGENSLVPFTSVTLEKGCTVTLDGTTSIQLNRCGVYEIIANISGLPSGAGNATIAMTKDGVTQPQATTNIPTVTTTNGVSLPIATLVQVNHNNTSCCCSSPVTIQFVNVGVELGSVDANVVVTKIC